MKPIAQKMAMQTKFPDFKISGSGTKFIFKGSLQPTPKSDRYEVEIKYIHGRSPEIFVRSPDLHPKAPHRYADGSLCLYHPKIDQWNNRKFVSNVIIPWTSLWLFYYEKWLEYGVWFGPEAPHDGAK